MDRDVALSMADDLQDIRYALRAIKTAIETIAVNTTPADGGDTEPAAGGDSEPAAGEGT